MIVVFGSNGMLGATVVEYLLKQGQQVCALTRKECDLTSVNFEELQDIIGDAKVVINCAGSIPQREKHDGTFLRVNSLFPQLLGRVCDAKAIPFIHVTTDCVYSGKKGKYTEKDSHDASTVYGISKSMGEYFGACIIRTSIIGEERSNKKSLLEWVLSHENGSVIGGYTNHYWNGVTCVQLAKIIHNIILTDGYWKGVRHIHSPEIVSKYELVKIISQIYGKDLVINPIDSEVCNRSLATIYGLPPIPPLEKQIQQQKDFWSDQ